MPISLGELLDKISILEIKAERISQHERLGNVRFELSLLAAVRDRVLGDGGGRYGALAAELKAINERIWDAEDALHGPEAARLDARDFLRHAQVAFSQNDCRALVKRQINDLAGCAVVEEKSYPGFGGVAEQERRSVPA